MQGLELLYWYQLELSLDWAFWFLAVRHLGSATRNEVQSQPHKEPSRSDHAIFMLFVSLSLADCSPSLMQIRVKLCNAEFELQNSLIVTEWKGWGTLG